MGGDCGFGFWSMALVVERCFSLGKRPTYCFEFLRESRDKHLYQCASNTGEVLVVVLLMVSVVIVFGPMYLVVKGCSSLGNSRPTYCFGYLEGVQR